MFNFFKKPSFIRLLSSVAELELKSYEYIKIAPTKHCHAPRVSGGLASVSISFIYPGLPSEGIFEVTAFITKSKIEYQATQAGEPKPVKNSYIKAFEAELLKPLLQYFPYTNVGAVKHV